MYWLVNTFILTQFAFAEPEIDTGMVEPVFYEARRNLKVHRRRTTNSALRGLIYRGDTFEVFDIRYLDSCLSGWADLGNDSFVCLSGATQSNVEPEPLPRLLEVAPPTPSEIETYPESLTWQSLKGAYVPPLVPTYHGRRTDDFDGWLYASEDAFVAGEDPKWRLSKGRDYRFVDLIETSAGYLLQKSDGKVAPLSEVSLYPASRFAGRDLELDPIPTGQIAGYAINREGSAIRISPSADADVIWTAWHREPLNLLSSPEGEWWVVPDALGSNKHGYIHEDNIRHWVSSSVPEEVPEGDIWIDVSLEQQMLVIYKGTEPQFVTLISSARQGYLTPTGMYRVYDKATAWDLASKPDSGDPYYIEQVPWVMHYYPRYAIHSAFWHDDFGHPASHGCINMSPNDAKIVFDAINPDLPDGWRMIFQTHQDHGSLVRIRKNTERVPRKIRN